MRSLDRGVYYVTVINGGNKHVEKEMASYLKNDLGLRNLLTASYTIGIDDENDDTYASPDIDVASVNRYNYSTSDVHGFHRNNIGFLVAHEGFNFSAGTFIQTHWLSKYNKPIFFSESGAHELWECDNHIETRRNIWQNAFWGVSGTLDWEIEQLGKHPNSTTNIWSIYQRVGEFFEGVDLDGGNWHAGMTRLRSNGNLKYKKSYRDDCIRDDELADVVYLRSGDKEKAFGVITNRRANYYTLGEDSCKVGVKISPPVHSDDNFPFSEGDSLLQHYGSVSPEGGSNRLRLRKMKPGFLGFKEYKIKYYSPYNLENSIKEETRWGPQHTLDFPDMDTLDIILFEVFPIGENFKNMATDTTNSDDSLTREPKTEKEDDVKVYPNPNDGKFVVFIESPSEVSLIRVLDNLGKIIDTRAVVNNTNQYNINNFNSGSYFIEVIFNDRIVRKKLVVN